jgi:hypothetical protein
MPENENIIPEAEVVETVEQVANLFHSRLLLKMKMILL